MASLRSRIYKAVILLELIDKLQQGPVNLESFCDNFNLTVSQKRSYFKALSRMELDLYPRRYSKETNIYLASHKNVKEAIKVLESKIKEIEPCVDSSAVKKFLT
ncbi:hypothetical protein [uncultured Clostridium sp.]|uniref:hypothetical protein n=1 Tax=uncultured Clostridium sp. TaxID=59620 RepID=UPI002731B892|nr:hypothetical protein [uncultured Clostridium sp.]